MEFFQIALRADRLNFFAAGLRQPLFAILTVMIKLLTPTEIKAFQKQIMTHYRLHGRVLPWRLTVNPYRIWVSEIMLQQTQVDRVIPKYRLFLKQFPTVQKLAAASLVSVLRLWQGLGYNRRARYLREAAIVIAKKYQGKFPSNDLELLKLPGIGRYTAAAIAAFAFNQPVVMIETNIRQVYVHYFFHDQFNINDKQILSLIEQTLDKKNPRKWYWALMDYGAYLKKQHGNINIRSKHYIKQSTFQGSNRQIRGQVIKELLRSNLTTDQLAQVVTASNKSQLKDNLLALKKEKLIAIKNKKWYVP